MTPEPQDAYRSRPGEIQRVRVVVDVLVSADDYRAEYGRDDDIVSYTTETVRAAARVQLDRLGWATVEAALL